MNSPKKPQKFQPSDNPIEQLKDLSLGAVREVAQLPQDILTTAIEQIGLKPQRKPLSGEINLSAGQQSSNINEQLQAQEASFNRKIGQLRSIHSQEKEVFSAQKRATEQQVQRVMQELSLEVKKLQTQTASLTTEVKKVTVEAMPGSVGLYHLNFFEWLIRSLRDLRQTVNESRQWLSLWTQKKKQKGYWAMFKKHGTSFAMSDERAVASSVG